jgi:hypothetical protein
MDQVQLAWARLIQSPTAKRVIQSNHGSIHEVIAELLCVCTREQFKTEQLRLQNAQKAARCLQAKIEKFESNDKLMWFRREFMNETDDESTSTEGEESTSTESEQSTTYTVNDPYGDQHVPEGEGGDGQGPEGEGGDGQGPEGQGGDGQGPEGQGGDGQGPEGQGGNGMFPIPIVKSRFEFQTLRCMIQKYNL